MKNQHIISKVGESFEKQFDLFIEIRAGEHMFLNTTETIALRQRNYMLHLHLEGRKETRCCVF